MTVKERALESLIYRESIKMHVEIVKEYREKLDELNKKITTEKDTCCDHLRECDIKEYSRIATKLYDLTNTNSIDFLNVEYENL